MKTTKKCRSCKKLKTLSDFYKQSSSKDGYKSQCKECISKSSKKYQADYYEQNKTEIKEHSKRYRLIAVHSKYSTWSAMKSRCNNKNHKHYDRYGGRGISVSEEFNNFKVWLKYVSKLSHFGEDGYTLDRIKNDGNYERGNIRWETKVVQSANRVKLSKANTTGYKGVFKDRKTYRARIKHSGIDVSILCGKTDIECAIAYDNYIDDNNLPHTKNF